MYKKEKKTLYRFQLRKQKIQSKCKEIKYRHIEILRNSKQIFLIFNDVMLFWSNQNCWDALRSPSLLDQLPRSLDCWEEPFLWSSSASVVGWVSNRVGSRWMTATALLTALDRRSDNYPRSFCCWMMRRRRQGRRCGAWIFGLWNLSLFPFRRR